MNELENLILEAKRVRQETSENDIYTKEMAKNIERVNSDINDAIKRGLSDTCFCVDWRYSDDLKRLFRSKGYTFKPTGDIGGIWQETVQICW